jgi:hypothetical protein
MSRIAPVVATNTETKVAATLSQLEASLGKVPNTFATLTNAPVAPAREVVSMKTRSAFREGRLVREKSELPVPVEHMTDEQIASAIRYLNPDPGSERSGDDGTVLVICFSLLILLIGALAITWLFLRTSG